MFFCWLKIRTFESEYILNKNAIPYPETTQRELQKQQTTIELDSQLCSMKDTGYLRVFLK